MSASKNLTLEDLANQIGATLKGNKEQLVYGIGPLNKATEKEISFFSEKKFLSDLNQSRACAIIISKEHADLTSSSVLISKDPYLSYAKATKLFKIPFSEELKEGISDKADIHDAAELSKSSSIGPFTTIGRDSFIDDGVKVGNGCYIGRNVKIGKDSIIYPNVTIYSDSEIGEDVIIHSGTVVGSDGLGFAKEDGNWFKIEHLGRVIIHDRVEIGSNSSLDKGSVGNTIISSDVKIDNLVHIAHNVEVGEFSAIAANSAIAGSSIIGKSCTIAGCCGVIDNISICDEVHITAMTLVTKSIKKPGIYSSGTPIMENKEWRKNAVLFKKLNNIYKKL
ncbi:MAG: UDP-3-O-(3-hydroxymyristoyl)glucosamine N-acyltransferase [SAR86 cluster bacterium]|nr:UDP-3-O-(3-hydroxymyristoyl)glucosamine N-acyltransferase [SAR86 cluster bacterium]